MPFGLPARDEANWDTKLNDSINAIKATADAAQPSATLDASVTAVDANAASALRVQQDARLSATFVEQELASFGEATATEKVRRYATYRYNASETGVSPIADIGGNLVGDALQTIWEGDYTVRATVTITATGGTADWTLGTSSATLAYNADAATVEAALNALPSVSATTSTYVTVSGGPGATAPLVVSYVGQPDLGFMELTVNPAALTGTGAGRTLTWVNKHSVDTGWYFHANDYAVTGSGASHGDGMLKLAGRTMEVALRSEATIGQMYGAIAEASWSGTSATGHTDRMVGLLITAGRHKNDAGAGYLAGGTAREVYGLYVNGVADGRTITGVTVTNGSPTITKVGARFTTVDQYKKVSGTGIPAGTIISSVSGDTATLSQNATVTGTPTLTVHGAGEISPDGAALTAYFGPGRVKMDGKLDVEASWKLEPAARLYGYELAGVSDAVQEWWDKRGGTRQGYITAGGYLNIKRNLAAREGDASLQVVLGSGTADGGTQGGIFFGSAADTYIYRPGAGRVTLGANHTLRTGRNTTANRPAAATHASGAMFYDTTLSKPIWSDGAVWRDAAGTAV